MGHVVGCKSVVPCSIECNLTYCFPFLLTSFLYYPLYLSPFLLSHLGVKSCYNQTLYHWSKSVCVEGGKGKVGIKFIENSKFQIMTNPKALRRWGKGEPSLLQVKKGIQSCLWQRKERCKCHWGEDPVSLWSWRARKDPWADVTYLATQQKFSTDGALEDHGEGIGIRGQREGRQHFTNWLVCTGYLVRGACWEAGSNPAGLWLA